MTLMEPKVRIQCRKEDVSIVQAQLAGGVALFQATSAAASGITPAVEVTVDTNEFLPPAPTSTPGPACTGGILLSAKEGQLLCRNTLDHRLDIVFDQLKPTIRGLLWGVREKFETKQTSKHAVSLPH